MKEIKPEASEYMESCCGSIKKGKDPEKIYPRLRLEHKFFPEAKKMKVGEEYEITLKVKMTGLSISKFQNDSEYDIIGCDMDGKEDEED